MADPGMDKSDIIREAMCGGTGSAVVSLLARLSSHPINVIGIICFVISSQIKIFEHLFLD